MIRWVSIREISGSPTANHHSRRQIVRTWSRTELRHKAVGTVEARDRKHHRFSPKWWFSEGQSTVKYYSMWPDTYIYMYTQ